MLNVSVNLGHQRNGLATAMYDEIDRLSGDEITPSESQSADAKAFWKNRKMQKDRNFP